MPSLKASKSLAEQLADFEEPLPRDVDPEAFGDAYERDQISEAESLDSGEEASKREHYQDVGKSKLRKQAWPALGKQYYGAQIARNALEDASSSEGVGDDDEDNDNISTAGNGESDPSENGFLDSEDQSVDSGAEPDSDGFSGEDQDSQASSQSDDDSESAAQPASMPAKALSDADRAAMREMMATEQKAVAASISKATQEDIAKGRAVKAQRDTYNSHLNTRIRLQKALEQANSMSEETKNSDAHPALEAAEAAALKLLNTISHLQSSLDSNMAKKRSFSNAFSAHTPSSEIHSALATTHEYTLPRHRAVLSKWSAKTQASSGRPQQDKFGGSTTQPLLSVLDSHLHGSQFEKHVGRTHIPRKCAPLQAAAGVASDANVYDDADFYALLLQEFVEARSGGGAESGRLEIDVDFTAMRRASKVKKKNVDTKASKGRKLRYTVHEKLQNFMAPRDIGNWGDRQADELFASLLGRKVEGGLGEGERDEDEDGNEVDREMEGLRLFKNGV